MTRTHLKIAAPLIVATAAIAFPSVASARIVPCDGDGVSTPCHVVTPPFRTAKPSSGDVRKSARKQTRLAQAAALRAIETGQWSGPYDPHRADG